ncbi:uncharacterized protein EMH_0053900 [Eimeria mitis]|uniref:Uncharacterized protein n=1 Tax=Eimeria mitis TaxID=44415 RepID=U6KD73_9EIME|nr:uncharacterized protein EMH_0053900 [Eimeria mitis]CDJ33413.1 hypothetical protein, conserved [Eimeria mitis]
MQVFRLRHPNDAIGGPEVMAACAQAAALLDAYRSLRSAHLDYHMQHDPHAGMSEDSAAWMAGRFNLMLQEDQAVANDKNVRKGLKWCIDSTLVVQQILSQRALTDLNETLVVQQILSQRALTDLNESPASPGNAFNNLLDASRTAGASHTRRIAQYLLSRCRDESKETTAQIHAWAALSVGIAETFFRGQLTCAINAQESSEIDISLVKAALSLGWGKMGIEDVLEPHALLVQVVRSIEKSRLLTDSDKKRIQKNCSRIGKAQMQPFWPFYKEPQHLDEALLSMYSVPSRDDGERGQGEGGGGNPEPTPEPQEQYGSNMPPETPAGTSEEGAEPSGEQPYPRGQPPPPPPPVHREKPPLQAVEESRPHQSVTVPVPLSEHGEETSPDETEEAPIPTQEKQEHPGGSEGEPPVPPPHVKDQPTAEGSSQEVMENEAHSGTMPIVPVVPPRQAGRQPSENDLHKGEPPMPPPTQPKEPIADRGGKPVEHYGGHPSPVPIPREHTNEDTRGSQEQQRKLPTRIRLGSASGRLEGNGPKENIPKLKRSPSDNFNPHRIATPRQSGSRLYNHRLLVDTGSGAAPGGKLLSIRVSICPSPIGSTL